MPGEQDTLCPGLAVHPKPCQPPPCRPALQPCARLPHGCSLPARPRLGRAEPPAVPAAGGGGCRWVLPMALLAVPAPRAGRASRAVSHDGTMCWPPCPLDSTQGSGCARWCWRWHRRCVCRMWALASVPGPRQAGSARGACGCTFPLLPASLRWMTWLPRAPQQGCWPPAAPKSPWHPEIPERRGVGGREQSGRGLPPCATLPAQGSPELGSPRRDAWPGWVLHDPRWDVAAGGVRTLNPSGGPQSRRCHRRPRHTPDGHAAGVAPQWIPEEGDSSWHRLCPSPMRAPRGCPWGAGVGGARRRGSWVLF